LGRVVCGSAGAHTHGNSELASTFHVVKTGDSRYNFILSAISCQSRAKRNRNVLKAVENSKSAEMKQIRLTTKETSRIAA